MGINYKGEIIIFSKVRNSINSVLAKMKENLYLAKEDNLIIVWNFINFLCIEVIFLIFYTVGLILYLCNIKIVGVTICILSVVYGLSSVFIKRIYELTAFLSFKILQYLLRYGKVVDKKDWKNIKKYCKRLYKDLSTKKSDGYCYFYSWALAMYLRDAKIMYCAIQIDNRPSGHAVVLKDNFIYDTNDRKHYDYDEYIKEREALIYKTFSRDEYGKDSFFDDIRQGFVKWCEENNAYCDPQ